MTSSSTVTSSATASANGADGHRPGLVDVHAHMMPDFYVAAAKAQGPATIRRACPPGRPGISKAICR